MSHIWDQHQILQTCPSLYARTRARICIVNVVLQQCVLLAFFSPIGSSSGSDSVAACALKGFLDLFSILFSGGHL